MLRRPPGRPPRLAVVVFLGGLELFLFRRSVSHARTLLRHRRTFCGGGHPMRVRNRADGGRSGYIIRAAGHSLWWRRRRDPPTPGPSSEPAGTDGRRDQACAAVRRRTHSFRPIPASSAAATFSTASIVMLMKYNTDTAAPELDPGRVDRDRGQPDLHGQAQGGPEVP